MTIDYKALLEKYMRHVHQCEGIDFTDRLNERMSSEVRFSDDEAAALTELSNQISENLWQDHGADSGKST